MIRSIKVKYTFIISVLVAFTIILCWVCNVMFLGRLYISRKISILKQTYSMFDMYSNNNDKNSEDSSKLYEIVAQRYNFDILVLDPEMNVIASNVMDDEEMQKRLLGYFFFTNGNRR